MTSTEVSCVSLLEECLLTRNKPISGFKEAEILKTLSRQDVINCFMLHIHPKSEQRRKLSVQCKSQIQAAGKFGVETAEAFSRDLQDAGVKFDAELFLQLAAREPPVEAVVAHWSAVLAQDKTLEEATRLRLIEQLKKHSAQSVREPAANDENLNPTIVPVLPPSFIVDAAEFKRILTISGAPVPVEEFRDLSTPKL
jgi:insulysin